MADRPNYLQAALKHPVHRGLVVALLVSFVAGLARGAWLPFGVFAAAELLWLSLVPLLPPFRRGVEEELLADRRRAEQRQRDLVAGKLSENARARLNGVVRLREKILESMSTLGDPRPLVVEWQPRLDALVEAALRILVAVDNSRLATREQQTVQEDLAQLEAELKDAKPGPARDAKLQRVEVLRRRAGSAGLTQEQREAAIAQFETIEDLLKELLDTGLTGRDSAAFATRIDTLSHQIGAAGETVGLLDRNTELKAELARRK